MGLLKSMEDKYPLIDSNFQDFCGSCGIFTVEDFLIHDLNALIPFAGKQPNSERLKQGIDQVLSIVDGLHRPWLNGVELLKDAQEHKQTLSLAYEGIDPLLNGALREGFVTELVGPSSSGKTQVCLQATASVAKGYAGHIVFIDSGNSFSAPRIAQILNQISHASSIQVPSVRKCSFEIKGANLFPLGGTFFLSSSDVFMPVLQDNNEALHILMENIWCYPVFDIFSLFDVLHQLELKLKSQMCSVRLLIVDSFSSLIIPILGGNGPYGHALMISAGNLLKKIAHEYSISVLVTNHMVAGENGSTKPALGESWKSVPHMRLLLSRDREGNSCIMSVIRHPSMAAGNQIKFRICDGC